MYEDDYTIEEDEFAAGWESLTAQLSEDEAWAMYLYESFQGQDA